MPGLSPPVELVHAGRMRIVPRRDVSPGCIRAQPPEDPVQDPPVVHTGLTSNLGGNKGWITDHSKSVRSKRAILASCSLAEVNLSDGSQGIPFMGM